SVAQLVSQVANGCHSNGRRREVEVPVAAHNTLGRYARYAVRANSVSGAGWTVARICTCTCSSTCNFDDGVSSPDFTITSVPGSPNWGSTTARESMARSLAE